MLGLLRERETLARELLAERCSAPRSNLSVQSMKKAGIRSGMPATAEHQNLSYGVISQTTPPPYAPASDAVP